MISSVQTRQYIIYNQDENNLGVFNHFPKIMETIHALVHLIHFGKMQRGIWDLNATLLHNYKGYEIPP